MEPEDLAIFAFGVVFVTIAMPTAPFTDLLLFLIEASVEAFILDPLAAAFGGHFGFTDEAHLFGRLVVLLGGVMMIVVAFLPHPEEGADA